MAFHAAAQGPMFPRRGRQSTPVTRTPLAVSLVTHVVVLALCLLASSNDPAEPEAAPQPSVTMIVEPAPAESPPPTASPDPVPEVELPPPEPPPPVDTIPLPRQDPPPDAAPRDPEPLPVPPPVPPARPSPPRPARPPRPVTATPFAGLATPGFTLPGPAASPSPPADAAPDPSWQQALGVWLTTHKVYPEEARRRGEDGRVVVRFTVERSGHVLDVELIRSSGSSRLDAATEAMLRGRQVPPFVASMTQDQVTVTVTIRYALSP